MDEKPQGPAKVPPPGRPSATQNVPAGDEQVKAKAKNLAAKKAGANSQK